ncbi:MAG: putative ABC transporter ATP-binding protein YhaQ [Isosphaeraceae bacterium]|nr:MAG: putative ABC transporter ATP-binding protein YhaQ [Isosphaeraceae bacterium]
MNQHDAIVIDQVTKQFGQHVAVEDLSLRVPRGTLYGFIGPNGSGKTTTLRMIMHILLPDAGRIAVLGQEDTRAAQDRVGYLPEERGLYKKMTVRRLLRYYGQLKGATPADLARRIPDWLERMGLADWADKKIETLSKGMAQKVQFMGAVVAEPELLILDEPFSGLDPVNAEVLKDAILDLRRKGTTIVFSTHDMGVAERLCDRIFMIYRGRKVLDGTLAEIQSRYGGDTLRIRTADGAAALDGLPGVVEVRDDGNRQEVRFRGDPQAILHALVERTRVEHFEVTHPSLHDIFVRIAAPEREVSIHALA